MHMYNLIEYSDNYSDICGSLRQFKRDEIEGDIDLTVDAQHIPNNLLSFITDRNRIKTAVPLKYLNTFWRSLVMPLINCKVELSLKWCKNCILSSAGTAATFAITDRHKTLCSSYYFKNWRQFKIIKTTKQGI